MGFYNVQAQTSIDIAPMNVPALQYTTAHFNLAGPVKKAGDMVFDKQGRLLENMDDGLQTYSYSKNHITVKKYGYEYSYKLNNKGQIISWSIAGEEDNGTFTYDEQGNLLEENSFSDGYTTRNTYAFDAQNRMISSTQWFDDKPYVTTYVYSGTPVDLQITVTVDGEKFMETTYYYKNGLLQTYRSLSADQWINITRDSYGNWTSFDHTLLGTTTKRHITYY